MRETFPLSAAGWRVYADELLERGDAHGEFIALQCERRDEVPGPREEQLRVEVMEPRLRAALGPKLAVTRWSCGLVDAVEVSVDAEPVVELRELAARTEGQGLTRVVLTAQGHGDLSPFWSSLADAPRFPRLEAVVVNSDEYMLGALQPLYAAYPGLKVLELHGVEHHLGTMQLPALTRFAASLLRPETITSLVSAHWPRLEELELEFGPAPAEPEPVFAALLSAPMSPVLREVTVRSPWPEFFRAALPRSPLGRGRVTRE